jgi:hypothetical protein
VVARFGGVKEWITDRYDAWSVPATIELIPKPEKPNAGLVPNLAESLKNASQLKGTADLSGVEEQYADWYQEANDRFCDSPNTSMAMPFYNRLRAYVLKLAVIFEVARSGNLKVSEDAMQRAIDIAGQIEETVFGLVKTGITREGSEINRMLIFIQARGAAGALQSELTKTFWSMHGRERAERLQTIVDSGEVIPFRRTNTGGRTGLVFVFKDFAEQHQREYPDDKVG